MSKPSADRNLLVGILALQMDFIRREQLIAAMGAWVLDKSKSLSEILVAQGALAPGDRDLLEPMVDRHVQVHEGDAGKSLAAVSSVSSLGEELHSLGDEELETSLFRLAPAQRQDAAPTAPWLVGEVTTKGRRFLILRPHAKGGLGRISVALDHELHREVALKEIQERFADDACSRSRFLQEAEITGGLEHPGIVPVYGLGQYSDGRPFYAMRFIRGDSLKTAITHFHSEDRPKRDQVGRLLELRKLLRRFTDVCNAVEYAHSRGVLHRDLKPGNIMLGKYGETLVVDWGLAKATGHAAHLHEADERAIQPSSGDDSTPTLVGSAVGTPEYMSPEQASGRLDLLGPETDVFSLGATLYCLLTGRPPFQGRDKGEVLHHAERGEFTRPRQVKTDIPRPLEAICLKAMSVTREARYPSPAAMAEDIDRWLADEPVTAYREPWRDAARRWARRHRPAVAAAAALLITLSAALLVGIVLIRNERDIARQERDRAEEESRKAEQASRLARQNAAATRQVVDYFLVRIGDDRWSEIPQFEQTRREMVEQAVEKYRQLLKQQPDDVSLSSDLAVVLRRAANLYRMMNQYPQAKTLYDESIGILRGLVQKRDPQDLHRRQLIELLGDAADLSARVEGPVAAESQYREAHDLALRFREERSNLAVARKELALAQMNYAEVLVDLGRCDEAQGLARESAETFSEFGTASPPDALCRLVSVPAWTKAGRAARWAGRWEDAESALQQAVKQGRANLPLPGPRPDYRATLASALLEHGIVQASRDGQTDQARAAIDQAVALLEPLTTEFPRVAGHRRWLAEALTARGKLRLATGSADTALADARRAVALLEKLVQESAGAFVYKPPLVSAYVLLSRVEHKQGNSAGAQTSVQNAQRLMEQARPLNPRNPRLDADAAEIKTVLQDIAK